MNNNFLFFTITALLLVLTGCGTKTPRTTSNQPTSVKDINPQSAQYWFDQAQLTTSPEKEYLLLKAVTLLIQKGEFSTIAVPLSMIEGSKLTRQLFSRFKLYQAILLTFNGDYNTALVEFNALQTRQFSPSDLKLQYIWHSQAYLLSSNFIEAIKIRILLSKILPASEQQSNQDIIWNILKLPKTKYLTIFSEDFGLEPILRGWLELALVQHQFQGKPKQLIQGLSLWKKRFPSHPAKLQMPTEITALSDAKLYNPKKIAVLLPQTGPIAPSAQIIRQGIEAAYFANPLANKALLQFYNSEVNNINKRG